VPRPSPPSPFPPSDTTYIIFTSDHGYNLGQFRLPSGKFHHYEHDIRVSASVPLSVPPPLRAMPPRPIAGSRALVPTVPLHVTARRQVPLYVRGPGIAPGVLDNVMVNNVDLAPTILEVRVCGADSLAGHHLVCSPVCTPLYILASQGRCGCAWRGVLAWACLRWRGRGGVWNSCLASPSSTSRTASRLRRS
jgi:hypothetical protein